MEERFSDKCFAHNCPLYRESWKLYLIWSIFLLLRYLFTGSLDLCQWLKNDLLHLPDTYCHYSTDSHRFMLITAINLPVPLQAHVPVFSISHPFYLHRHQLFFCIAESPVPIEWRHFVFLRTLLLTSILYLLDEFWDEGCCDLLWRSTQNPLTLFQPRWIHWQSKVGGMHLIFLAITLHRTSLRRNPTTLKLLSYSRELHSKCPQPHRYGPGHCTHLETLGDNYRAKQGIAIWQHRSLIIDGAICVRMDGTASSTAVSANTNPSLG